MKTFLRATLGSGLVMLVLVVGAGCSTRVDVSSLDAAAPPGTAVNGIPFRAKQRYQATLYRLVDGQYEAVPSKETVVTLANQQQLYLLSLKGSALSDSTVTVNLNADNTLSGVSVESKSKGAEALSELSGQMKGLSDAKDARETSEKQGLSSAEDARLAAFDARTTAEQAKRSMDALPDGADKTDAEQALVRARLVANQKARRAELPLPYPSVGL